LLKNGYFFYCPFHLKNFRLYVSNLNNLLPLNLNLSNFLNDSWNFNHLLYNSLYVFVYPYDLGNDSLNFNNFGYFNKFGYNFLYLINSWNSCWSLDNFLYDLLGCNNLLYFRLNDDNFLYDCRNLLDYFRHVRYDFLYFFDSFIHNNFLYNFFNVLHFDTLLFCFNNLLNELRNLDNLF